MHVHVSKSRTLVMIMCTTMIMTHFKMANSEHVVEFDLETLQPLDAVSQQYDDMIHEIPFPEEYQESEESSGENLAFTNESSGENLALTNDHDNKSISTLDSDHDEYYTISSDSDDEELPSYGITNKEMTTFECWDRDNNILIDKQCWENNILIEQDDELCNWKHEMLDSGLSTGHFQSTSYTNVENPDKKPEVYFNSLFDERMWTVISEATNVYARSKHVTPTGNKCTDPTHDEYRKHCRLNTWINVSPGDIKLFMAHILIMGLVNKSELEKYWSLNSNTKIPFFGKYMSRNRFQAILWNLHVNDDSHNPRPSQPGHDPLCKIRPFVDMVQRNFLYVYKPRKELSFDEACCPFKGRV